jgi:hypothetical protein
MSSRSPSLEPTLARDLESFGVRDGVGYFHTACGWEEMRV